MRVQSTSGSYLSAVLGTVIRCQKRSGSTGEIITPQKVVFLEAYYALSEKMCLYIGYISITVFNPHELEWFLLLRLGQFFWGIQPSPETCAKAQEKHEFQMCHMNICHLYDPHPTTLATVTAHHTSILAPIEPYSISLVLSVVKIAKKYISFVSMDWIMQQLLYPHCKYIIVSLFMISCSNFFSKILSSRNTKNKIEGTPILKLAWVKT